MIPFFNLIVALRVIIIRHWRGLNFIINIKRLDDWCLGPYDICGIIFVLLFVLSLIKHQPGKVYDVGILCLDIFVYLIDHLVFHLTLI
jgi:hypothetical protein